MCFRRNLELRFNNTRDVTLTRAAAKFSLFISPFFYKVAFYDCQSCSFRVSDQASRICINDWEFSGIGSELRGGARARQIDRSAVNFFGLRGENFNSSWNGADEIKAIVPRRIRTALHRCTDEETERSEKIN